MVQGPLSCLLSGEFERGNRSAPLLSYPQGWFTGTWDNRIVSSVLPMQDTGPALLFAAAVWGRTSSLSCNPRGQHASLPQAARCRVGQRHLSLTHTIAWQTTGSQGQLCCSQAFRAGSPASLTTGSALERGPLSGRCGARSPGCCSWYGAELAFSLL